MHRKIDEVPSRAELIQYQKRFIELYRQSRCIDETHRLLGFGRDGRGGASCTLAQCGNAELKRTLLHLWAGRIAREMACGLCLLWRWAHDLESRLGPALVVGHVQSPEPLSSFQLLRKHPHPSISRGPVVALHRVSLECLRALCSLPNSGPASPQPTVQFLHHI